MADFQNYIAAEKIRLSGELEKISAERAALDARQAAVSAEMRAVAAYETAKTGKAAQARGARKATGSRRGSKRAGILAALTGSAGMTRGELLDKLGMKGDKSGEMSVSNALTALTKAGTVARKDGKYIAA